MKKRSLFLTGFLTTGLAPGIALESTRIRAAETATPPAVALSSPAVTAAAPTKYGMSLEEGRQFWSYKPVKDSTAPNVKNAAWVRTPVDNFILARLEHAGITPAPAADKRTLLRRVTFDLTGLPPTPGEMADFLADASPGAFAKVVDRLLASPRYGETWGRHWLDVVRYADTCGNASDFPVPQAHKYRDWVIGAFNRDMPYDQFLREQIAGDLLPESKETQRGEQITATGYLAIARRFGGDRMGEFDLTLDDTIDNLGKAMLGSTISCARCHDHKFDPFTQNDYYGLYGILSSTRYPYPGAEVGKAPLDFVPLLSAGEIEKLQKPYQEKLAAIDAGIKQLEAADALARKAPNSPEKRANIATSAKALAEAKKKRLAIVADAPVVDDAYAVADGQPANAKIHMRGDPKRLGDEVPRHFPAILGGKALPSKPAGSGRLELAGWIADAKNPLTARVMVNRIWQYHFGKGIVDTPNDFGRRGTRPTHPELLDFLAARFVENGWSINSIHRMILLSQTWQLASTDDATSARIDPNNDLCWKYTRHRLDAEAIRDTLLFVSGDLKEELGGGHPFPPVKTWNWTQHNPFTAVYPTNRRSVYLMQQRLRKNSYLALFDGADPSSSTGARLPSTTPLQALFMMNDPLAHASAEKFAWRLISAGSDVPARVDLAFQLALNRPPDATEQQEAREFLQVYQEKLIALNTPAARVELQVWSAFSRALLSGNEFVFVD